MGTEELKSLNQIIKETAHGNILIIKCTKMSYTKQRLFVRFATCRIVRFVILYLTSTTILLLQKNMITDNLVLKPEL